jgi:thiosulfate/3-mercaptopyruvate sulfurtransferase
VLYSTTAPQWAARVWWMLRNYGFDDAAVLNGGFQKWLAEGRAVTHQQPHVEPAKFKVGPGGDCLCRIDEVREGMARDDTVIWDVRARAEYTGEEPRQNKRAGHIPGAVHMEWMELTAPPARSGLLLPPAEMRSKLAEKGITPEKQVLVH